MIANELLAFISKPSDFNLEWTVKAILSHFALGYLFALIFYIGVMRFFLPFRREIFRRALFIAFIGALLSVGIDADHFVRIFGVPYGRHWHKFWAVVALAAVLLAPFKQWLLSWRFWPQWARTLLRRPIELQAWSLCIILHVLEDYYVGWF